MAANPPITSIPAQLAQPSEHILRYLTSIHPYVYNHAEEGTNKLESISRLAKEAHDLHSNRKSVANLDSVVQKIGFAKRDKKADMGISEEERWQGESDTESARRRLNRKLRRRENAAIRKPLRVSVASPAPPEGERRRSKQSRQEYFSEEEEDQERPDYRPDENERRMSKKQTKMPEWLEKYRYKNVTEGRLTLPPGRKAGFLTKGKASRPVKPPAQTRQQSAAFDEQSFLKRSRRQSAIESEENIGWRKRQVNTARPSPVQQSGHVLERHSRRSGTSYPSGEPEGGGRQQLQIRERRYYPGELPPPGIQGSPSWPTQGDRDSHVWSRRDGTRAASLKVSENTSLSHRKTRDAPQRQFAVAPAPSPARPPRPHLADSHTTRRSSYSSSARVFGQIVPVDILRNQERSSRRRRNPLPREAEHLSNTLCPLAGQLPFTSVQGENAWNPVVPVHSHLSARPAVSSSSSKPKPPRYNSQGDRAHISPVPYFQPGLEEHSSERFSSPYQVVGPDLVIPGPTQISPQVLLSDNYGYSSPVRPALPTDNLIYWPTEAQSHLTGLYNGDQQEQVSATTPIIPETAPYRQWKHNDSDPFAPHFPTLSASYIYSSPPRAAPPIEQESKDLEDIGITEATYDKLWRTRTNLLR